MTKKEKLTIIIIFFVLVLGFGYYFLFLKTDRAGNTVADNTFGWQFPVAEFPLVGPGDNQLAYSDIRDPGGIPKGLPVRLKIPAIGVNSAIEDALITPDGRMDVPSGSVNVAWFALGPNPGEVGSAVIGGHFGIRNGVKFVFYDLDKLVVGDKIYIENDKGETLAFQVRKVQLFDRNADATNVFTSNDGLAHLNLITCEGIWNRVNDSYPERRVVFADAIKGEGAVTVNTKAVKAKLPSTAITTPEPIPAATSPAGSEPAGIKIPTTESSPTSQNFIQSVKILYDTPIDGLVTSVLLIAILFLAVKLLR